MKVGILYSGGKDSTYAIADCLKRGWEIRYLLSVKPSRTDCFLFHYATVEHTPELALILKLPHVLVGCDVADPQKEAELVRAEVEKLEKVDAIVLGGVGLQETQLRSVQDALRPLGIEVFAMHAGMDHEELFRRMIAEGYEIIITQIAADGLNEGWLGKQIDKDAFEELKRKSQRFGFHLGFEGGHADTLVTDGPIFGQKLEIVESKKVVERECVGHLKIEKLGVVQKAKMF